MGSPFQMVHSKWYKLVLLRQRLVLSTNLFEIVKLYNVVMLAESELLYPSYIERSLARNANYIARQAKYEIRSVLEQ